MSALAATEGARGTEMGWEGAVDGFREHLKSSRRLKQKTRWDYCQHVRWLAATDAETSPWEVTSNRLASWLDEHNWSQATRRNVLVSLQQFYAWGVGEGYLDWAPTAGLARRAARRPGPAAEEFPPAWRDPMGRYVETLRAGARAESTIAMYLARLRPLTRAAADPWAVTTEQLAQLLSNPDWAPATKRGQRVAFTAFYTWAVKAGHLERSPAAELDTVRVPRALPRPAPEDALRAALAAADDRTRLAVMLAVYAGLRRGEIASLHASQISETHLMVVGKGGHHRLVPLDPRGDLITELRAEMARRRAGGHGSGWGGLSGRGSSYVSAHGYLFPSHSHAGPITAAQIGKIVSAALPGDLTTHTLRHRFATNAYAVERDLMAVQQLLGHARPETTAVYAQVPDGALLSAVVGAGRTTKRWGLDG